MNYLRLITLIIFLSISHHAFSHVWGFSNLTDKRIVLKLKLYWDKAPYFTIIEPGDRASMDWSPPNWKSGYCLDNVQWAFYRPELPYHGGLDLITNDGVDNHKFATLLKSETNKSGYDLKTADLIFFPDDVYIETLKYSEDIGRGSDFICMLSGKKSAKARRKVSKVFEPIIQNAIDKLQTLRLNGVRDVLTDTQKNQQKWIDSGVSILDLNKLRDNLQKVLTSVNYKVGSTGSLSPTKIDEEMYAKILHVVLNENEKLIGIKAIYLIDMLASLGTALEYDRVYPEDGCKGVFTEVIAWLGGFVAKSSCRSREFQIWEDRVNKRIIFSTAAQ